MRFQVFFRALKPDCIFSPDHILPGDLVSFLQRERDAGATFASLKDASASISMACREATDGSIALGEELAAMEFRMQLVFGSRSSWSSYFLVVVVASCIHACIV